MAMGKPQDGGDENLEQHVRSKIQGLTYLPTSLGVAMKFIELGRNHDADPNEYVKVLSSDAALISKILSLANSSWFGIRNRVTRPLVAINLLGLGTVRTLAISYCLTGLHNKLRLTPDEARNFWTASLCKAVAAKQYAQLHDSLAAEEAFTAGLLQDFALPVIYSEARQVVATMMRDTTSPVGSRLAQEHDLYGMEHGEAGRLLAQGLALPDFFVNAIAYHHDHKQLCRTVGDPVLAEAIYVASLFPHALSGWNPQDAEELRLRLATGECGRKMDARVFLSDVQQQFDQIRTYFEQGDKTRISLEELLEAASTQLADAATRMVGAVQVPGSPSGPVAPEPPSGPRRDGSSPLLSQEAFAQHVTEQLKQQGCRRGHCLAMIAIDLPGQASPAATDLILEATRQSDLVSQVDAAAFLVLIPDCSSADADHVVYRIQSTVARCQSPGRQKCVATIGYLWLGSITPTYPFATLVNAVTRLLDEARHENAGSARRGSVTQPDSITA